MDLTPSPSPKPVLTPAPDRQSSAFHHRLPPFGPLWLSPRWLCLGCLCGSLLLLLGGFFQPQDLSRRRAPLPPDPNQPSPREVPLWPPAPLPQSPNAIAPVLQWFPFSGEAEVKALVNQILSQTYAAVSMETGDFSGIPLDLQIEIFNRGQEEPELLRLGQWYRTRDRLRQQILPSPAPAPQRWRELTHRLPLSPTQSPLPLVPTATAPFPRTSAEPHQPSTPLPQPSTQPSIPARHSLQALARVELRLHQEEIARKTWNQAREAALVAVSQGEVSPPTVASWEAAATAWQAAIQKLEQISPQSLWGPIAADRQMIYRSNLATTRYAAAELKPNPLKPATQRNGIGTHTSISLCQLEGDCRHFQGDTPIIRPASLSKIPIALSLLLELRDQGIPLNTQVSVSQGNNTEDGGKVRVGRTYSLETLLQDMIANSSNVASNQLIDYLGWETLNLNLQRRGYRQSRVTFKFVGVRQMPSQPGSQANVLTSQELTAMMQELYTQPNPGRQVVRDALGNQIDRELAYAAFQGTKAQWIGEKTGRTSQTTGTTVIFSLDQQIYILSLIDQSGLQDHQIQTLLRDIVTEVSLDPEF
ncbi:MAG: serine hydrolase [Prochlorothrix sp.]